MNKIQKLRQRLEQQKGKREQIVSDITDNKILLKEKKRELRRQEKAREVIREVGLKTQEQLQFHISEITSLALDSVFPEPYELVVEFVERRNRTECDITFKRDGEKMKPLDSSGGGAIDVASFALRVASWSMARPRSRSVLILDEPFRYLSEDLIPLAGKMLKQISEELKLQIIMVTHSEDLIESADKVFRVKLRKGVSHVSES